MKTKLLLPAALIVCLFGAFTFSNPDHVNAAPVSSEKSTSIEFGEFNQCGIIYAVYGDATTGTITAVKFFNGGGDVYSFSGSATFSSVTNTWSASIYINPNGYTGFNFSGELLYY